MAEKRGMLACVLDGCAVLGAGGGVGGRVGFVGDDSVRTSLGGAPIELWLTEITPGSLHCASRRVRRSEREEKASARFGRDDSFCFWRTDCFGQGAIADCKMTDGTGNQR